MSDEVSKIEGDNIVGCTCPTDKCEHYPQGKGANVSFLPIEIEVTPKGVKYMKVPLDKFELAETDIKYIKFRILEDKK